MIIDLILDRKENEEQIKQGYTHENVYGVGLVPLEYNPENFYRDVFDYFGSLYHGDPESDAAKITYAMDFGTEADVKKSLCDYILDNEYNPEITNFINSVNWL